MLNPCITINNKITKHRESRSKAKCDAHLKSKYENNHVAKVNPTIFPSEAVQEPSASIYGSCGTTASGLAGSRLGSPCSGFSPGATAYLASRGRVNTPSHWSDTFMVMSSCRPPGYREKCDWTSAQANGVVTGNAKQREKRQI